MPACERGEAPGEYARHLREMGSLRSQRHVRLAFPPYCFARVTIWLGLTKRKAISSQISVVII